MNLSRLSDDQILALLKHIGKHNMTSTAKHQQFKAAVFNHDSVKAEGKCICRDIADFNPVEQKCSQAVLLDAFRHVLGDYDALAAQVEELASELKIRAKQIGVACLEHDLTHTLTCGKCYQKLEQQIIALKNQAMRNEIADTKAKREYDFAINRYNEKASLVRRLEQRLASVGADYNELIMAVAKKFPGETRHHTALRYIRQAEATACQGPAQCDTKREPQEG